MAAMRAPTLGASMDTITSPTITLPATDKRLEYKPWRDNWGLVALRVAPLVWLAVALG